MCEEDVVDERMLSFAVIASQPVLWPSVRSYCLLGLLARAEEELIGMKKHSVHVSVHTRQSR